MRDLIVFGEDFGGLPSSTQHLVKHLATTRKVLWVNSIGLRQPKLNWHDTQRALAKLCGKAKAGYAPPLTAPKPAPEKQAGTEIQTVNLRTIPAPQSAWARHIARDWMLRQIKPIIERAQLQSPILWCSLPTAADLCGHLGESGVIYYCGDDFSSLAGVDHKTVAAHESLLAEKANLIFAASPTIQTKFPPEKTHFLPHGVDLNLFTTPAPRAKDLPQHGPVAGFYGSLSAWLDYEMIEHVATTLSHWQFVFIGPNELPKNRFPNLANLHILGPRPHHQLPRYSQHWDVSLLPFVMNAQINACSPLKLMEYLAAGRPIITTDYPAISPYRQHLNVVDSAEAMIRLLSGNDPLQTVPTGVVSRESWESRSQWVAAILESL